ncbi:MAG: ribosome assembly RNA-binding protein YhbY [Proteobacteria bacterium]|nr:ribosome assembly RNA-binding protein YhbY [Pseudomonadota bacterium]
MTNPKLNDKQRKFLRGLAHDLNVILQTGSSGLTDAVIAEIDVALKAHELIKVRFLASERADRDAMIEETCTRLDALFIQRVGHVATLFRRNPDKPKIELPKK